ATGGLTFNQTEGSATLSNVLLATFSDPGNPSPGSHENADDYSATVNWGDGSGSDANTTIVNNNNGTWSVYGTHSYAGDTLADSGNESEGSTAISVTISHDATTPQTVSDTLNVSDPNVAATGGLTFNQTEGSATLSNVLLATFSDPGNPSPGSTEDASDYSATVNWGDGSGSDANTTIVNNNDATWSVYGSHSYSGDNLAGSANQSEGSTAISVTISHDATTPQTVSDTLNVSDSNVAATGGLSFNRTEGSATLSNVLLATFSDPGNPSPGAAEDASDYSATVNWGDGSGSDANTTI